MRVIADTHAFLWWNTDDSRLSETAVKTFGDPANIVLISAVVGLEISIKAQLGKLQIPDPPPTYVIDRIRRNGFVELPVTMSHSLAVFALPLHHRDPFDRILVAQSLV